MRASLFGVASLALANPSGLLFLALSVPVVVLHLLRPRRRAQAVASTLLWAPMASPVSAARPWQRLRPTWLLFLQILAVALFALAIAEPVRRTDVELAPHTVFIVDVSGSMAATDGSPDRLSEAKARASDLRAQLPSNAVASLVAVSTHPRVLVTASADRRPFDAGLAALQPSAGPADFTSAFILAASLETPDLPVGFVLLSDGGLRDDEQALLPDGTLFVPVGRSGDNQSVVRVTAQSRGVGTQARVTLRNDADQARARLLRVARDGIEVASELITLEPHQSIDREFSLDAADRVTAHLDGTDLLGNDDTGFAVRSQSRSLRIVTFGPPDPFVDELLPVLPGVVVERRDEPGPADGYDLAVFNRVRAPEDPGAPFLAIAPPGGLSGAPSDGFVEKPAVALVRNQDPLLEDLDLSVVAIASAQRVTPGAAQVLVGAEGAPLLLRGVQKGRPFLYLTFALADSNLPLDVSYPVLVARIVQELTGSGVRVPDLRVGDALPIGSSQAVDIIGPTGRTVALSAGQLAPVADTAGFYVIRTPGRPDHVVAVGPARTESDIAPVTSLAIEPLSEQARGQRQVSGEEAFRRWVLALLVAVLVAEMLLSRRGTGVSRRQWRVAAVARTVILAFVVVAAVELSVPRPATEVATVFLVDASDSVGSRRGEAVDKVRDALATQPSGSKAAVALFGGDARLELTLRERADLATPTVRIDSSRTNLANALRLAAAILPDDHRRRVVLISDGRATVGDVATEAERLRQEGIVVDVIQLASPSSADVALLSLDAPNHARIGERVELRARIVGPAGPAVVTLSETKGVIEERQVELRAGENVVAFFVTVETTGVHRFRVAVDGGQNSVRENDVGFAAVQVGNTARVLLVEGVPGRGAGIRGALSAAGLASDSVATDGLGSIEEIAGYASVVLVDVDADQLSGQQVTSLGAFTRDLGHGLVVVGGTHSFGVGGYRDSPLEELLPVTSEILDPKRRQTVALVLSIDTSGSMGGCASCGAGGPAKNELAQATADRAIRSLAPSDEIGVLAVDTRDTWILDLQPIPGGKVLNETVGRLGPGGGTKLDTQVETAMAPLLASTAAVKHIVVVTDGETDPAELARLADSARRAADAGVTVSVVAVGSSRAGELGLVAREGRGRFVAADDVQAVPTLIEREVVQTSRSFINEGAFLPVVTAQARPVQALRETPPLAGFVATTPKPAASVWMRVGEHGDPLLASWQLGLGRVTTWTADGGERWATAWADWEGWVPFWAGVVKDVAPAEDSGGVAGKVQDGLLRVRMERAEGWPDGATARARVSTPDGGAHDLALERIDDTTFVGEVPVAEPGVYALGALVEANGLPVDTGMALVTQSYSAEYLPGEPDRVTLSRVAAVAAGRFDPPTATLFDAAGLPGASGRWHLGGLLLAVAAVCVPIAIALGRFAWGAQGVASAGSWRSRAVARASSRRRRRAEPPEPQATAGGAAAEGPAPGFDIDPGDVVDTGDAPRPTHQETVDRLLANKRRRGEPGASGGSGRSGESN